MKTIIDNIIIEQDKTEMFGKHGIILHEKDLDHLRPNRGTVICVGEEVKDVKQGDRVFFSMYAGRKVKFESKDYIAMREKEVFGILGDKNLKVNTGNTIDHAQITENLGGNLPF